MNSRRKFIFDCSAVMAALTVAPMSSFSRSAMGWQAPGQISYPAFVRQVNTIFEVHSSSGQVVKLKLLKALLALPTPRVPGRRAPGDAGNEKFSLIFSGPKEVVLPSAIHWFEHPELGRFELYIGQIGTEDRGRVRYESVFNRPGLIT